MDNQGLEDSQDTTSLLLQTAGNIAQITTYSIIIGAMIGIVIGVIRGSFVDLLIFSASMGSMFAALGFVVGVLVNASKVMQSK
jgi:hypothetical protein